MTISAPNGINNFEIGRCLSPRSLDSSVSEPVNIVDCSAIADADDAVITEESIKCGGKRMRKTLSFVDLWQSFRYCYDTLSKLVSG